MNKRTAALYAGQLAACALCFLLLRIRWPTIRDFVIAVDHGDLLFADFVRHYHPTAAAALRGEPPAGGFFYPAAFAAMLAPLGLLPIGPAELVWAAVELLALGVAATWIVQRAAGDDARLAVAGAALTATSIPMLHGLKWGQVSAPIFACVAASFLAYATARPRRAAILFGAAAAMKGYPVVFGAWFALRRDYRFAGRAALVSALALAALPAIVLGPSRALFVQRVSTGAVLGAADGVLKDFNSQYAPAVVARYVGGWDALPTWARGLAELGSLAVALAIMVLVMVVARSSSEALACRRELLGVLLLGSTLPFWLRTSWAHYFVHLPAAQVLLASLLLDRRLTRPRAVTVIAGIGLVGSIGFGNVLALLSTDGWWYYANAGMLLVSNALVIVGFAIVIVHAHLRATKHGAAG